MFSFLFFCHACSFRHDSTDCLKTDYVETAKACIIMLWAGRKVRVCLGGGFQTILCHECNISLIETAGSTCGGEQLHTVGCFFLAIIIQDGL